MISGQQISKAKGKIAQLFMEQCTHGAQSTELPADYAACGQFIGPDAKDKSQSGLHGVAAAVRVLAQADIVEDNLLCRLINYLEKRNELRSKPTGMDSQHFEDDEENVIKISEVLYALSFVQPGQCETEALKRKLAGKLLAARVEGKGWPFFLSQRAPNVLPTAFAVMALSRLGGYIREIQDQVDWLKGEILDEKASKNKHITETSAKIFCLFVLAYRNDELERNEIRVLTNAFEQEWRILEPLLRDDVEQNLEYWHKKASYYVRIPWQLYLLALAARLKPGRLWSVAAQRRLDGIINEVLKTAGFRYPYSGATLSSRTNAILYDTLEKIRIHSRRGLQYYLVYWFDFLRTVLSHPMVSYITLFGILGLVGFTVYRWYKKFNLDDLGPGFIESFLLVAVGYLAERLRKSR